jgi:hypothetical protein
MCLSDIFSRIWKFDKFWEFWKYDFVWTPNEVDLIGVHLKNIDCVYKFQKNRIRDSLKKYLRVFTWNATRQNTLG